MKTQSTSVLILFTTVYLNRNKTRYKKCQLEM